MRAIAGSALLLATWLASARGLCEGTAAQAAAAAPSAVARVAFDTNAYGKRVVAIDGKLAALYWCYGLEDPADLDSYKECGFNTVWVPVPWNRDNNWDKLEALIRAAAEHDLWVVLGVETGWPKTDEAPPRVTPRYAAYRKACSDWIQGLTERYKDTPNLIAWATQDDPGQVVTQDDAAFQDYLRSRYPSERELSVGWQVQVDKFEQVTLAGTPQVDHGAPPFFARPSLDLLLYRWQEFANTLDLWAKEIRSRDRQRLLFTGRIRDYKGLISVPRSYDAILPELLPGQVENDLVTHNAHGIDIARRGGAFCVLPNLFCGREGKGALPAQLAGWMRAAALHGAGGMSLSDWPSLKNTEELRKVVRATWEELLASGLLWREPRPTTAILYEPTGEGVVANNRPVYGYGEQFSLGEPSELIYSLHAGTRQGQFDYLGVDSLSLPRAELQQYGAILAPLALTLNQRAQAALLQYVSQGGVLVADLGLGMADAGDTLAALPPPLQELIGDYGIQRFISGQRNMSILVEHPLFPSLQKGQLTTGNGVGGTAFTGVFGMSRPWRDAVPFGLVFPGTRGAAAPGSCSLTINRYGNGYAVYAPFRLWANWLIDSDLWAPFHDSLFSRRASLTVQNTDRLAPPGIQVAALQESLAVANFGRRAQAAVIDTVGANNLLLTDCVATLFSSSYPTAALYGGHQYGRLGETELARAVDGERSRPQRVHVTVPAGELRVCRMVPVRVEPEGESCLAQVVSYTKDEVRLEVYSESSRVQVGREGQVTVQPRNASLMRVVLYPGLYEVAPNSAHVVTAVDLKTKQSTSVTINAGTPPMIVFPGRFRASEIVIQPAQNQ